MTVYMKVSRDKYELPIAVGDTWQELADILGVKYSTIQKAFQRKRSGKKTQYITVEIGEEEDA